MLRSTFAALLIVILASASTAAAPAAPEPRPATIREAARQAALTETVAQARPRQRSWVERHPVLIGTIVGAGVGASVGGFTCKSPIAEGDCDYYTDPSGARAAGMADAGAWGAGIGALIGVVASIFVR